MTESSSPSLMSQTRKLFYRSFYLRPCSYIYKRVIDILHTYAIVFRRIVNRKLYCTRATRLNGRETNRNENWNWTRLYFDSTCFVEIGCIFYVNNSRHYLDRSELEFKFIRNTVIFFNMFWILIVINNPFEKLENIITFHRTYIIYVYNVVKNVAPCPKNFI